MKFHLDGTRLLCFLSRSSQGFFFFTADFVYVGSKKYYVSKCWVSFLPMAYYDVIICSGWLQKCLFNCCISVTTVLFSVFAGGGFLINVLFYVVPFCMVTGWNGFVFLILIIRIWNFAWWKYLKEVCGNTISKSLWVALNLKIASVYIESAFWSRWFIWSVFLPLCLFVCFIIIKKSCLMWFSIYITMRERKRNQLVGKLFFNPKNTWYQFV